MYKTEGISRRGFLRTVSVATIGLSLGATSCGRVSIENMLPQSPKPLRLVDRLQINIDNNYRYATHKNETEGIQDLIQLAEAGKSEESWIYLPDKRLWVEIGINEYSHVSPIGFTLGTRPDSVYISSIMKKNDNLIHYHIQPNYDLFFSETLRMYPSPELEKLRELWKELPIIEALPSANDFICTYVYGSFFYGLHPSGKLTSKICSRFGVTECSFTDAGREWIRTAEKYNVYHPKLIPGELKKSITPVQHIQDLCKQMSNDYLTVRFIPHK